MTDAANRILATRPTESDAERRLREAINRHAGQLLGALDAALALRTAPGEAQRTRHRSRGHLADFAAAAMQALAIKEERDRDAQQEN